MSSFDLQLALHCGLHLFARDKVPNKLTLPIPEYYLTLTQISQKCREELNSVLTSHYNQRLFIVTKAIDLGELCMESNDSMHQIEFANTALCLGVISLIQNGYGNPMENLLNQHLVMVTHLNMGYKWKQRNSVSNKKIIDMVSQIIERSNNA